MNKYIKEQGIISLIKKYADFGTEEIFEMAYYIADKLYYNKLLYVKNTNYWKMIVISILTNNSFLIVSFMYQSEYTYDTAILEHKFNKNEKEIYEMFFKDPTNSSLNNKESVFDFKQVTGKKINMSYLRKYKVKLFHVGILVNSGACILKSTYDPNNINIHFFDNETSKIYDVQDIFPKKIIYYSELVENLDCWFPNYTLDICINITNESCDVKDDFFSCDKYNKANKSYSLIICDGHSC
jgi:hypothetical protein